MKYNRELNIAVGRNRKETSWTTRVIMWSDFIKNLSSPAESKETQAEYRQLTKAQQDELKDIGGFIGGVLTGNRRKSGSVKSRCLITLDMDNIPAGETGNLLKRIAGLGCSYVVYSTRKHEGAAPRLRVIVPTDRDMLPDEYEPIARKTAELIGIDYCDPTTFQAERFMYWPSICKGAEYVFQYGDNPFLSADGVLNMYENWKKVKEWPKVSELDKRIERNIKRQQDPTEKNGVVGAFCRVYDIPAVIEKYLSESYEPCGNDRYTYTRGSTTGGAVLYEGGKFLYSNHATDPASSRLCNAFDLVRMHKFGHFDEDAKPDTPSTKLESYSKMCEMALQDPAVKKENIISKFPEEERADNAGEWIKNLEINGDGKVLSTSNNVMLILANDPLLKGAFQKDDFSNRIYVLRETPWKSGNDKRDFSDTDMAGLRVYLETRYRITGSGKIQDALHPFYGSGTMQLNK